MPILSGLEVAIYLQEEGIATKVALISGVQDFEYARTALSVRAADYILKPIKLDEITATAKKLRDIIDLELNREKVMRRLSRQAEESVALMREKFLEDLISGTLADAQDIRDRLEYFAVPIDPEESVAVAVAEIDDYSRLMEQRAMDYRQFVGVSVRSIMESALTNRNAGICINRGDNEFVIIFNQTSGVGGREGLALEAIKELLRGFEGITISVGIGNRVNRIEQASVSYRNARKALGYKFYAGKDSIIGIEDVVDGRGLRASSRGEYFAADTIRRKIVSAIVLGDAEKTEAAIEECFSAMISARNRERGFIHGLCIELIGAAYQELKDVEGGDGFYVQYREATRSLLNAETVPAMREAVSAFALSVADCFKRKYCGKNSDVVRRIQSYVDERIAENLSLSDIAEAVYLSLNYICSVFKKETGETINEYIIRKKMEKAKRMLAETKLKIWEIAESLGYENHHYFSFSFKKHTGLTPQQFRG
jgi:two-component system response regulator YesN